MITKKATMITRQPKSCRIVRMRRSTIFLCPLDRARIVQSASDTPVRPIRFGIHRHPRAASL
jgi:hypothetical protein